MRGRAYSNPKAGWRAQLYSVYVRLQGVVWQPAWGSLLRP